MSLQVWLPLNGSLENRGCSDVEITSSGNLTYSPGGKIGNCFDNSDRGKRYIKLKNALSMGIDGDKSICFWVKAISGISSSNDWGNIFTTNSSNAGNGLRASINTANANQYQIIDKTSPIYVTVPNRLEWNHIAIVSDSALCKVYVNGVYQASASRNLTAPTATTDVAISNNTTGSEVNWNMRGYINDFRLYDHCLSPKEVHEIAQGLVLHYPLNNIGGRDGNENLLINTGKFQELTITDKRIDGYLCYPIYANGLSTSKTYTLSCECDGLIAEAHLPASLNPSSKRWSIWTYQNNSEYNSTNSYSYTLAIVFTSSISTYKKSGNHYSWTFTPTYPNISIRLNIYSDGTNNTTVTFRNIKLEEGSVATPWCPNVADPEYAALGYNSNVVSDCSGYGNDGIISGDVKLDISGGVYNNSTNLTTIQSYIEGSIVPSFITSGTISLWCKIDEIGSNGYLLCSGQGTYLYAMASSKGTGNFYHNSNRTSGEICYVDGIQNSTPGQLGIWHHYVVTNFNFGEWTSLFINNYIGNSTSSRWNSKITISDFRIYSTALSAEDVKALYQQGASIDNLGSMHTYGEFNEGQEKISIGKNKVVSEGSVNEASFYENIYLPTSQDENSISTFIPTTATNSCGCTLGDFHLPDNESYTLEFDINFTGFETCGSTFSIYWRGQYKENGTTKWWSALNDELNNKTNLLTMAKTGGTFHIKINIGTKDVSITTYTSHIDIRSDYSNGTGKIIISNRKLYKTKYNNDNKTSFLNDSTLITKEINEE